MPDVLSRAGDGRRPERGGFTVAEMLVAMTVLGILALAFTRLLLTQGRFADQQNAFRGARSVARQSMNVLVSELRMVQDSGFVDSAATDGKAIRVLVPYWFGLNCGVISGTQLVSMLPVDSLMVAQAKYYGYAWRAADGSYTKVFPAAPLGADAPTTPGSTAQCSGTNSGQARINVVTIAGRTGQVLQVSPTAAAAPLGEAIFFFQRVTFAFKASVAFPGNLGLWRLAQGGADEELVAPFDTTARFKYWTSGASASVAAPPALGLIRGVDVVLAGVSAYPPAGKPGPAKATLVTAIFFKNVRAF